MTDPQLPPPSSVPHAPMAPAAAPPAPYGYVQQPASVQAPPPGAYQVPVGGYQVPVGAYVVPASPERLSPFLGVLALLFSLVAAIVVPVVAGIAGYEIGRRIPESLSVLGEPDLLALLSPARDQVLWAELAFWVGTALGIAAIVIGIIAIRRRQGRGQGIFAIVIATLAPVIYFVVLGITVTAGAAAGAVSLYS